MTDEEAAAPPEGRRRVGVRTRSKDVKPPVSAPTRVGRILLAVAGTTLVYYVVPVDYLPSGTDLVTIVLGMLLGLAVLVYVSVRQLRVLINTAPGDPSVRLDVLALAVIVVVPIFSLGYYALWLSEPAQFAGLETRTDALYFGVTTLATVGFGDIHAVGQLARVLVTLQMLFDLIFVAVLVSVMGTEIGARARRRLGAAARDLDDDGPAQT